VGSNSAVFRADCSNVKSVLFCSSPRWIVKSLMIPPLCVSLSFSLSLARTACLFTPLLLVEFHLSSSLSLLSALQSAALTVSINILETNRILLNVHIHFRSLVMRVSGDQQCHLLKQANPRKQLTSWERLDVSYVFVVCRSTAGRVSCSCALLDSCAGRDREDLFVDGPPLRMATVWEMRLLVADCRLNLVVEKADGPRRRSWNGDEAICGRSTR
jgi:hypothetical protein